MLDLANPPAPTQRLPVNPADFCIEPGYVLEPVVIGLNFPTAIGIRDHDTIYIAEAGYSYGPARAEEQGRILELNLQTRQIREVASGFAGPITSTTWFDGAIYVLQGAFPGKVWRVTPDGRKTLLIDGLRSGGDHYTGDLVFDKQGNMYFGVGTVTNSAVVGFDNYVFGWLPDLPDLHDVPARDYILTGENYNSINPLDPCLNPTGRIITTGAFKPFGTPTYPGELIPGRLYANGVIYTASADGQDLRVYADGLRNPFGLGFSRDGRLFATDQGYDCRGSRPIANAPDPLWVIREGGWYGWPDFVAGEPVDQPKYAPAGGPIPARVIANPPPVASMPVALLTHHSASVKFDLSRDADFGFVGDFFIAQLGTGAPVTTGEHRVESPGFRVVRVNPNTGQVNDFLVNLSPGPPGTGIERPIDCKFSVNGEVLFVLDFGIMTGNLAGPIPWANSGMLWRVRRVY